MSSELENIAAQFGGLTVHSNPAVCRTVLTKVMRLQMNGTDCAQLLPGMLKLLAHPDLATKKAVYHFTALYANKNPEVSLLAVNTLMQECSDSNPVIRGLALKTLSSLNHESFIEYGLRGINMGLTDKSVYVRRVAACCCGRLYKQNVDLYNDGRLINQLYTMLRDSDPIVIVNSAMALEEILSKEGGIVINRNIANHLLNNLQGLTPWGQCYVLSILQKYKPKTQDELFNMLNILDSFLISNHTAVASACLHLFLSLISTLPHLRPQVFKRYIKNIVAAIPHGNTELVFHILEHLNSYRDEIKAELQPHYSIFFCKESDPLYLKKLKLVALPHLAVENNAKEILGELFLHASNSSKEVSLCALQAVTEVFKSSPTTAPIVIKKLKQLIDSEAPHILSNIFQVLKNLELNTIDEGSDIIMKIADKHRKLTDSEGRLAFLCLLSQYGNLLEESPYILEEYVENFHNETSTIIKYQILMTCVHVFFHHPAAMQGILGQILELCLQDSDKSIQSQALFYYRLLSNDVRHAKMIISTETRALQ
ncbi:AP-4 complex subunit beta-1-like [Saccostrea echinata]|uniref:AP-4 complex subunit beta-1-like n=1 Tax=Saccostrea echinata TaxID=191078 RepID=UPI002A7EC172|nr:AP-4 complex subunit beta-1-like [Saccostrea echinata]